jgi:hypothetical protein
MRRFQWSFGRPMALSPCQPVCEPPAVASGPDELPFVITRAVLGARFRFSSNSRALLDLAEAAYGGLPEHREPAATEFSVELCLLPAQRVQPYREPPSLRPEEILGVVCGELDESNHALVMPHRRRALVVASEDLLEHPRHLRQELIEFAVYILAARGLGLVPLHGACFGKAGRGVLLLGDSGSGKSTLVLQALLRGLDLLSEDAVFVQPGSMLATGVPNYLHVRTDAPDFSGDESVRSWIRGAPVIRRNSGVRKFEVDLRRGPGRLSAGPLELKAVVFVSSEPPAGSESLLEAMDRDDIAASLASGQDYAITQPGWHGFSERVMQTGAYRLRRGDDPAAAITALRQLLD